MLSFINSALGLTISFYLFAAASVVALYLVFYVLSIPLRRVEETEEETQQRIAYGD